MLKSLLLASALTMAFPGTAMADNTRTSTEGCTTCSMPISSANAPVKMAQVRIPRDLGSAQQIDFPKDIVSRGPCCPPITSGTWAQYFVPQQSPGKNVTLTYGYDFVATVALDAQMKAYAPFAALWTPAGHVPNSVALVAEVRSWPTPAPPANWNQPGYTDVYPGKKQLRAWFTNGTTIWTGAGFEQTLWDNQAVAPNHFNPNLSYSIRLSLVLNYKKTPNDNTWFQLPLNCMEKFVRRGSFIAGKVAPGASVDGFRLQD